MVTPSTRSLLNDTELSIHSRQSIDSIKKETVRRKERLRALRKSDSTDSAGKRTELPVEFVCYDREMKTEVPVPSEIIDGEDTLSSDLQLSDSRSAEVLEKLKKASSFDDDAFSSFRADIKNRRVLIEHKMIRLNSGTTEKSSSTSSDVVISLRSVSFRSITERHYPLIPGVSPAVSRGPPMQLDWHPSEELNFDFETYENSREGKRRTTTQLKMPPEDRLHLLRDYGHSLSEIRLATKTANVGRRQRIKTVSTVLHRPLWLQVEERIERYCRALQKPFRGCARKQHEQEMRRYHPQQKRKRIEL